MKRRVLSASFLSQFSMWKGKEGKLQRQPRCDVRSGIPDVAREQAWALLGRHFCISRARTQQAACEYRVNFPAALPGVLGGVPAVKHGW